MKRLCLVLLPLFFAVVLLPARANAADRIVSVDLKDADLRQAISIILRDSGINYVFADDVKGTVTAHLDEVPVDQALQAILNINGYEAIAQEGAYLIRKHPEPATAIKPDAAANPKKEEAATAPKQGATQPTTVTEEIQGQPGFNGGNLMGMPANGGYGPYAQMPANAGYGPYAQMPGNGYGYGYGMMPYYLPQYPYAPGPYTMPQTIITPGSGINTAPMVYNFGGMTLGMPRIINF
ncbi:MAG TPA: secretin and TonB N-terminal domain-containing protein [Armatimonadota bacterium]|nr:secretin and TonB N-terminal domain-containing protein [Armatimonadota bacterium]